MTCAHLRPLRPIYNCYVSSVLRRSFHKSFRSAVRGDGVYVWDTDGQRYFDLSGSAAVNFIGHGVTGISAAMAEQAAKLEFVHSSQFTTPIAEEYAEELLAFAGDNFQGGASTSLAGDRKRSKPPSNSHANTISSSARPDAT